MTAVVCFCLSLLMGIAGLLLLIKGGYGPLWDFGLILFGLLGSGYLYGEHISPFTKALRQVCSELGLRPRQLANNSSDYISRLAKRRETELAARVIKLERQFELGKNAWQEESLDEQIRKLQQARKNISSVYQLFHSFGLGWPYLGTCYRLARDQMEAEADG